MLYSLGKMQWIIYTCFALVTLSTRMLQMHWGERRSYFGLSQRYEKGLRDAFALQILGVNRQDSRKDTRS